MGDPASALVAWLCDVQPARYACGGLRSQAVPELPDAELVQREASVVRRETLQARKRFAADLAERDAQRTIRTRRADVARDVAVSPGGTNPSALTATQAPSYARTLPPTDAEILERYRMRRWWLDRYTLDEIRELAGCLR